MHIESYVYLYIYIYSNIHFDVDKDVWTAKGQCFVARGISERWAIWHEKNPGLFFPCRLGDVFIYPIGSMYAIYGNMDPINIPQILAYIPAPWILRVYI